MSKLNKDSKNQNDLNLALSDIEFFRELIEGKHQDIPDRAELAMTSLVTGTSLILLLSERFVFTHLSDEMISLGQNSNLRSTLLIQAILILGILGLGVYGLAWLRARNLQSSIGRIINRKIKFLRLEYFFPDLLLKVFIFSLVILSGQLQFVAALLVAFSADYAMQGKFFRFQYAVRLILGIALYLVAAEMILTDAHALFIPLVIFTAMSLFSFLSILIERTSRRG